MATMERSLRGTQGRLSAALTTTAVAFLLTSHLSLLTGQTLTRQTDFQTLRDSLASTADTNKLRAMLRMVRHSDPLRAGLVGLRLGELGADPGFSEALSSFRGASRGARRAEAWYGLGLAETGRSEWEMRNPLTLGSRVGLRALERAASDYIQAIRAEPGFVAPAVALAAVTVALLDTARLRTARDALRRATAALPIQPAELSLARGRIERAAGSLDSACVIFERYLAVGGNRALGLLELGRTRLASGRADGEAAYYDGASREDDEATAGYRADLALLADTSDLNEFDQLRGTARVAYLRRFWTDRDHLELRAEGERLREHYRRLLFAWTHFPLTISRRYYGRRDAYQSGNHEIDDRGIIYIRHGDPDQRLRPFVFGTMPNESWHYARSEGDLFFHFTAGYDRNGGGDLYDYRLVQSILDLHGADDAPIDQLLLSRQTLSPLYGRMLNWGTNGSAQSRREERHLGTTSIWKGTTTDSYQLRFGSGLVAVADLIAVGRSAGGNLAHFVFGIAAPGTSALPVEGGVAYPVRVRLVVLDTRDRAVARLDTMIVVQRREALTRKEYLIGRAELTLPTGLWSYRAALQEGESSGVVLRRDSVAVVSTDGASFSLSDIAMGTTGHAVTWVTQAADTVLLSPTELFSKGAEVEIYYEANGAAARAQYQHQITVLRDDGWQPASKRRPMVSLSFSEEAADPVIRSRRTVRLEGLKPGSYLVEVRITAPDGSFQVRRRSIRLGP
jgi:GWxTD domain-containing protein